MNGISLTRFVGILGVILSSAFYDRIASAQMRVLFPGESTDVNGVVVQCRARNSDMPNCNRDGAAYAKKVCFDLPFINDRNNCLEALSGAVFVDKDAAMACREEPFTNDVIRCMSAVRDKFFDEGEVNQCRNRAGSYQRFACFNSGGYAARCQPGGGEPPPCDRNGISQAKKVCNDLPVTVDQQTCLESIARARFVDSGAVSACAGEQFSRDVISCMRMIPNKYFDSGEVEGCKNQPFVTERLRCYGWAGYSAPCF